MKLRKLEVFRDGLGQPPLVFGPTGSDREVTATEAWHSSDGTVHVNLASGYHLVIGKVPFILTLEP